MNKLNKLLSVYRNTYNALCIITQSSTDYLDLELNQEELDEILKDMENPKVIELISLHDDIKEVKNKIDKILNMY